MNRYKTFAFFLVLVCLWSLFFSTIKFFLWSDLKTTLNPSLQVIAWYLSLGSVISYLIWWALAYTFLKKYLLFSISFLALVFTTFSYIIWFNSHYFFAFIIIFIWFFYWLWSVLKNILISIEIKKTWLPDTTVNALVWIFFVVSMIFWSVFWSLLFEKFLGLWYIIIIWILVLSSFISLLLDYDKISFSSLVKNWFRSYLFDRKHRFVNSMRDYFPDMKFVVKKYFFVIVSVSLLWAISTIVSQKAVEYSVDFFHKEASSAAFVLLYSALWAIIWNIVSMKMNKNRWFYLLIFNTIFSFLIIVFPFLNFSFFMIGVFAFVIWIFFWISSNIIDAYFFKKLWEDDKKEYGSSIYWLIMSFIIFVMMFFANKIWILFGFDILMFILWFISLFIWLINLKRKD